MNEARLAFLDGSEPIWVVADQQTGGRGRHGRQWTSPPGNLYATLALADPCAPSDAPQLGFAAGLALHAAIASASGIRHPRLGLKWPNDLLLDGAKLSGLLLEGLHRDGRFGLLIGFGINIASAPIGLPYAATALQSGGADVTRDGLFSRLSTTWLVELERWRKGFTFTRSAWLEQAHGIGAVVTVRPPGGSISGRMLGIDASGRLRLATTEGEILIDAGDVSFGG